MKVLYSNNQKDWKRTGTSIYYGRKNITENYSTSILEFIHDFDTLMDTSYFCYGYPYTYSLDLKPFIKELASFTAHKRLMKR